MKSMKKWIILLLCIIFLILFILLGIAVDKKKQQIELGTVEQKDDVVEFDNKIELVKERNTYYNIEYISKGYTYALIYNDLETLYNVIDKNYITKNNITLDNIDKKIEVFYNEETSENEKEFIITKMLVSENSYKFSNYFVYGYIQDNVTKTKAETCFAVELDLLNSTYYILPYEAVKNMDIKEGNIYTSDIDSIEANEYNKFEYYNTDDYTVILDLMDKLKDTLSDDFNNSYNLFLDEYKEKRFSTFDKYKEYVINNWDSILSSSIKKYKISEYEDYTEYICIDQYGNYYIFHETATMQFTVQLDTYTLDSEEFLNKYNNGSEQLKVGMNLERIFQALNRHDYEYIYSKLDNTFKQNNFATLDDFKVYMKNNFFDINKVTYNKFEENAGIYVYNVKITNAKQEDGNSIEKNFIMKLGENTDFTMSFNK